MGMARADKSVDERSFRRRLQACEIERERPWRELLGLERNGLHANILERAGIETFGDLADALDEGRLVEVDHVGEVTRATLAEAFGRLLEQGRERYLYGERGRPATTRELIDQALELPAERTATVVVRHFMEGKALAEIGRELELTRERIRQLKENAIDELSTRFGDVARELVAGVLERLEASCGLACWSHLEEQFDGPSPSISELVLVCRLAGLEEVDRWGELLVVDRRICSPDTVRDQLAEFLRGRPGPEVSLAAVHTWADRRGTALDDRSAVWLAQRAIGLDLSDGPVRAPWWTGQDALLATVDQIETPADVPEIRRSYETIRRSYPSLPDLTDHTLRQRLGKAEQIYNYGHGVYVHMADLPVAPETLEEAADRVVERLDGEPEAVGIARLLDDLQTAGLLPDAVTPHMLKTVLTGRPELETFRNTLMVADRESFEHDDVALIDRIERVLRRAEAPMTLEEITEALSEYSYARVSVASGVRGADFALRWEYGRYFHRDVLGLGDGEVETLLTACLRSLPDGGAPRAASRVYDTLDSEAQRLLEEVPPPPQTLWALAEADERFDTGYAHLLARSTERDQSLWNGTLLRTLEAIGPADFRDVCEYLERQRGISDAEMTIRNALQRLRRGGHISCDDRQMYRLRVGEENSVGGNRRGAEVGEGKQRGR
jgi:hypothetical protein